jgi:type I restriction enzyme S subunit
MVSVRADPEKIYPKYLFAALRSSVVQAQIDNMHVGTMIPHFKKGDFGKLSIPVPSRSAQHEIGDFYFSISERINLLRETNTTLEAIAQALFKSWFVDFDPVHAKMQGRAPEGMDEATAALFPDSFEESELGSLPKGWHAGTYDTLANLNPESWSATHHPEQIHYVDLANTKAGQIDHITEFSFDGAPSRARRVLRLGDVIVGTVRPGNRSFARIGVDMPGLTGSTGFAVLRAREKFDQALVYIAATSDEAIDRLTHLADGGAYPAVRPEVVASAPLVVAHRVIREAFGEVANTIFETVGANQERMRLLASLRDTLLPRLISGQLNIMVG